MAENSHAINDIRRSCSELGGRAEIGGLLENREHTFGICGFGQLLTIQAYRFRRSKYARRVDETATGVYPAMKFKVFFRRQYFAGGEFDKRALRRLNRQNCIGREHQFELLVGSHKRINVRGSLAAERAIEIVELHEGDVAVRVSDRDLAR